MGLSRGGHSQWVWHSCLSRSWFSSRTDCVTPLLTGFGAPVLAGCGGALSPRRRADAPAGPRLESEEARARHAVRARPRPARPRCVAPPPRPISTHLEPSPPISTHLDPSRAVFSSSAVSLRPPLRGRCRPTAESDRSLLLLLSAVQSHISSKHLSTAYASASETARTGSGDCTEHAVLLAALVKVT
jgi:hypothetical protein